RSLRMPLQISSPSESGSMISSKMRSGRTWRQSSIAPFPVWSPLSEKPSFSRLYFNNEKRSASSSISRIFFMMLSPKLSSARVTEWLRASEFGIKLLMSRNHFVHRQREIKGRSFPYNTFHASSTAVGGYQVLHDGESETGAAEFARPGLVHAVK